MNAAAFDPLAAFANGIAAMKPASQRVLASTWRQHAKACARQNEPAWPLSETNIELSVRRWIACGASGRTLKLRRWAFVRWLELAGRPCDLQVLSLDTWTRFVHSSAPRRRPEAASQLTVHETSRLIDAMQRLHDLDWLSALVILINLTGAPLRTWLQLRQCDVVDHTLTLRRGERRFTVHLESTDYAALRPLLKRGGGEGYVFSADSGATPLPPQSVNRHLRVVSQAVLGHAVTMRMVHAAALRFLLQLGISTTSLSEIAGLSRGSIVRLSGLHVEACDYSLVTRYGVPVTWQAPSFADFYRIVQASREPYAGARDRAILSLLFFSFATPDAISAMECEDVDDAGYSLPRDDDLYVMLSDEHVLQALDEWIDVRGSQPGPLFLTQGTQDTLQRMSAVQIEHMVCDRTRGTRRPFDASSLRRAGMARAAQAGLPLAQLADTADLGYEALAEGLGLYQCEETVAKVTQQIEALRAARFSAERYGNLCLEQLVRCYIHAGTP